ncbi:hypothetical protein ABKA04_008038 [Annulohypoxylon sp. FPYF3050]
MSDPNNDNGGSNGGFLGHCFRSCFGGKPSSSEPTREHVESKESSEQTLNSATARPEPGPAQTPYVPSHAKESYLKTTTTPEIKKANEIL